MNMDESANRIGFSHKRDETRSAEMAAGVSREQDRADMLTMIVARARARVSGGNKLVPRLPGSTRYSCATAGLCSSAASAVWFLLAAFLAISPGQGFRREWFNQRQPESMHGDDAGRDLHADVEFVFVRRDGYAGLGHRRK